MSADSTWKSRCSIAVPGADWTATPASCSTSAIRACGCGKIRSSAPLLTPSNWSFALGTTLKTIDCRAGTVAPHQRGLRDTVSDSPGERSVRRNGPEPIGSCVTGSAISSSRT